MAGLRVNLYKEERRNVAYAKLEILDDHVEFAVFFIQMYPDEPESKVNNKNPVKISITHFASSAR